MKKIQYSIVIIILLITGFAFYWYEFRPSMIRKNCNTKSQNFTSGSLSEFMATQANYDENYKKCLREYGLEK